MFKVERFYYRIELDFICDRQKWKFKCFEMWSDIPVLSAQVKQQPIDEELKRFLERIKTEKPSRSPSSDIKILQIIPAGSGWQAVYEGPLPDGTKQIIKLDLIGWALVSGWDDRSNNSNKEASAGVVGLTISKYNNRIELAPLVKPDLINDETEEDYKMAEFTGYVSPNSQVISTTVS